MASEDDPAKQFFQQVETRWAFTNLLLRSIIRHVALTSSDPARAAADVFDHASLLVDTTMDTGANPVIGTIIHQLIDDLAADVAADLQHK